MKNYDEPINTVFKRINEYETEKEYTSKFMVNMATSLCCVCFVALLAFGVLKRDWSKKEVKGYDAPLGNVESQEDLVALLKRSRSEPQFVSMRAYPLNARFCPSGFLWLFLSCCSL